MGTCVTAIGFEKILMSAHDSISACQQSADNVRRGWMHRHSHSQVVPRSRLGAGRALATHRQDTMPWGLRSGIGRKYGPSSSPSSG